MRTTSIKALGISCLTTLLLAGCGGSDDDDFCCDITPASSSSSSSVASSAASSTTSSAASSASSSSVASADLSYGFTTGIEGWYINGSDVGTIVTGDISLEHDAVNNALKMTPLDWTNNAAQNWVYQARMDFEATTDLSDSHIDFTVSIPESYVTDGALEFQIIIHAEDSDNTEYGTNIALSSLEKNADGDYVIGRDIELATAVAIGLQISKVPTDTELKDPILIKSILIDRPDDAAPVESSSSSVSNEAPVVDFESDAAGTAYDVTGWVLPDDITATVVTIASVTAGDGLPANGDSTNVLKVTPNNYNAIPLVEVTLPDGKTLADYSVTVDAYFPNATLGLTEGNNAYKDLFLLAGTEITSGANNENTAYQSHIATEGNVDQWKTFTLTVDSVKAADLTGTIQLGVGINRPGNTDGNDDSYYLDNITLVEIE